MERCTRCNMPAGKFNTVLNEEKLCNYCECFDIYKDEIVDADKYEPLLMKRVGKYKGKYDYDALVGLSGGKDSSYILYQLAKKYNFKVLVCTYDNGFLTEFSKNTIETIVKELGVDHFYYKPNWEIHKKLYKAVITNFGDPCIACAFVGFFLGLKLCSERKIPFFIHGRTPYQMYKNMFEGSADLFLPMNKLSLQEHSFEALSKVYKIANEKMKAFVRKISNTQEDADAFIDEFFVDTNALTPEFTPEFLAYFLFERYDEEKMKNKLAEVFGWKKHPGESLLGHNDCAINAAAGYLFKELHGTDVLDREVGTMIRFGDMTKEQGIRSIEASQPSKVTLENSLNRICELCDYEREDLDKNILKLKQAGVPMFTSR